MEYDENSLLNSFSTDAKNKESASRSAANKSSSVSVISYSFRAKLRLITSLSFDIANSFASILSLLSGLILSWWVNIIFLGP